MRGYSLHLHNSTLLNFNLSKLINLKSVLVEIDVLENDIIEKYPQILETLLQDHTKQQNIFWATNNYIDFGNSYSFSSPITPNLITGENGQIIMPRVKKDRDLQISRVREMAEVFTPSWICNAQNNLIDYAWFGRENVFNTEIEEENGNRSWVINEDKIKFPKGIEPLFGLQTYRNTYFGKLYFDN